MRIKLPKLLLERDEILKKAAPSAMYITTDSREAEPNDIFADLIGSKANAEHAEKNGASYVCDLVFLQALAYRYRMLVNPIVAAITGSVGKTTTKDYIYATLSEYMSVHKTAGNFNNAIGLPISLLTMPEDCNVAVLELGTSSCGEIRILSEICRPDIAVITSIGTSHLEHFGTREITAREKLDITYSMTSNGLLLLNGDEALLRGIKSKIPTAYVGKSADCEYRLENIKYSQSVSSFRINGIEIKLGGIGYANVAAASFAFALGKALGLTDMQVEHGISLYKGSTMRKEIYDINKITVIEDCYNASYESMLDAIETLDIIAGNNRRKIAVLGDMLELGALSDEFHRMIGEKCREHGIDLLFTIGELAVYTAKGALDAGMKAGTVFHAPKNSHIRLAEKILSEIKDGDVILFKASRAIKCEKTLEYVKNKING